MSAISAQLERHFPASGTSAIQLWWFLVFPLLCLPFVRIHGAFYGAALVFSLTLLLRTDFRPAAFCLVGLHLYQLIITLLWTGSFAAVRDLNSPLMIQTSIALMAMGLLATFGLRQAMFLSLAVSLVAVAGLLSESLGIDLQGFLPSKYHETQSFTPGAIVYTASDVRLRGVYAEASAVGAVCGGLAIITLLALLACKLPLRFIMASLAIVIASVVVLVMTLTKAGFAMLIVGAVVGIAAMIIDRQTVMLWKTVLCLGIFVALFGLTASFLPQRLQDYLLSEWDSVQTLVAGGEATSVTGKGAFGRSEGYEISAAALLMYPLGSAQQNVVQVATDADIPLSEELSYYFSHGIYGLKNYVSNLAITAGLPGLILFVWYLKTLCATFRKTTGNSKRSNPAEVLIPVSVALSLVFAGVIEERYFVLAYAVMVIGLAYCFVQCQSLEESR
jgi:hypothetical protein